ncbi:MAG TPA: carbohydrate kinase family protein [Methylomirabilota bacterium]|nr:carbohydrate kinase family protein [Methylomirabilota bacterium]
MTRHYDVITMGETTMDAFMTLHDSSEKVHLSEDGELCFKHGEKINVERYDFQMGGNATNVAVGLSRLGLKATLVSEIGDDELSIKIRNSLAKEEIERLLMIQTPGPSSFSVIINFKSDRTIFVQDVEREHKFHFDEVTAKYIYITSLGHKWEHAYKTALDFAGSCDAKVAFNPGHLQIHEGKETVRSVLEKTEILFVNKEEAEQLVFHHYGEKVDNTQDYIKALAEKLQKIGAKIVVITNGRHGSYALDDQGEFYAHHMAAGKVVERTGAGDAYTTGFLAATIHGLSIADAMEWGTVNASSVVGHIGAEAGLLTKEQMEEKVKE